MNYKIVADSAADTPIVATVPFSTVPLKITTDEKEYVDDKNLDVHNMLYEKNEEILKGLYKAAGFVIQAIVFKEQGKYIHLQKELLKIVSPTEKEILTNLKILKNNEEFDFTKFSETLFNWSKNQITK